jgi:hypothetical protein
LRRSYLLPVVVPVSNRQRPLVSPIRQIPVHSNLTANSEYAVDSVHASTSIVNSIFRLCA